jgi:hypothetical protein
VAAVLLSYNPPMQVQLVLVDDWELRGNGAGDMRVMQFDTLRRLLAIYESHGLRASINAEVMQQLHHLEQGERFPALRALAQEWEAVVLDAYARGHDVQLHVHGQWHQARYEEGRWVLSGNWSLPHHRPEDARDMIRRSKRYLEELLRSVDPGYRCVSFRSGQWCLAPSDHMLSILAEEGFAIDLSMVGGLVYDTPQVKVDYRSVEEPFLPFFPDMKDARRVAREKTPIVCFPTFSYVETRGYMLRTVLSRKVHAIRRRLGLPSELPKAPDATPLPGSNGDGEAYSVWSRPPQAPLGLAQQLRGFLFPAHYHVADLAALTFPQMQDMLDTIRCRARRTEWSRVPVILENHTKDIGDFAPLEAFARHVASQPDFEVLTLRELHRNLEAGLYAPVLRAAS